MKYYNLLLYWAVATITDRSYCMDAAFKFYDDDNASVETQPSEAQEKTEQEAIDEFDQEAKADAQKSSKHVTFKAKPIITKFQTHKPTIKITQKKAAAATVAKAAPNTPENSDRQTALYLLKLDSNSSDQQARAALAQRKEYLLQQRIETSNAFEDEAKTIQFSKALSPERKEFLLINNKQRGDTIWQEYTQKLNLIDQISRLFSEKRAVDVAESYVKPFER